MLAVDWQRRSADNDEPLCVVDLASGCSPLSMAAAQLWSHAKVFGFEADARAVCAARTAIGAAGLSQRVTSQWWNAGEDVPDALHGTVDVVLCNPLAHTGLANDLDPARAMFRAAGQVLRPGGRLYVVANRQLPHERDPDAIGTRELLADNHGFKVLAITMAEV